MLEISPTAVHTGCVLVPWHVCCICYLSLAAAELASSEILPTALFSFVPLSEGFLVTGCCSFMHWPHSVVSGTFLSLII